MSGLQDLWWDLTHPREPARRDLRRAHHGDQPAVTTPRPAPVTTSRPDVPLDSTTSRAAHPRSAPVTTSRLDRLTGIDLTSAAGGPRGQRAVPRNPAWRRAWMVAIATLVWILGMLKQAPCLALTSEHSTDAYGRICYTDIRLLYLSRPFGQGQTLYTQLDWEYPPLSGLFAMAARWISDHIGFAAPAVFDADVLQADSRVYFAVSVVMLYACFLVVVLSQIRLTRDKPWLVLVVGASPLVITASFINWDLLAVALTALGLVAWRRKKPVWAGVWWGLAVAAKLYPAFLLAALLFWCVRERAVKTWLKTMAAAVLAWLAVNLPYMIVTWHGWVYFWTFNAHRGAEYGSLWHALQLLGLDVPGAAWGSRALIAAGLLALGTLVVGAPRRPSLAAVLFVGVGVFVLFNVVYSPQYVWWLLPLVVLARPYALDLIVFTVAETAYSFAIWLYLAQKLNPTAGSVPTICVGVTLVRCVVLGWLMVRAVLPWWHKPVPRRALPVGPREEVAQVVTPEAPIAPRHVSREPVGGQSASPATAAREAPAEPVETTVRTTPVDRDPAGTRPTGTSAQETPVESAKHGIGVTPVEPVETTVRTTPVEPVETSVPPPSVTSPETPAGPDSPGSPVHPDEVSVLDFPRHGREGAA